MPLVHEVSDVSMRMERTRLFIGVMLRGSKNCVHFAAQLACSWLWHLMP